MVAFLAIGPCLAADLPPTGGGFRALLPPVRSFCRAGTPLTAGSHPRRRAGSVCFSFPACPPDPRHGPAPAAAPSRTRPSATPGPSDAIRALRDGMHLAQPLPPPQDAGLAEDTGCGPVPDSPPVLFTGPLCRTWPIPRLYTSTPQ